MPDTTVPSAAMPSTAVPRPVVLTGGIGSGKSSVGRLLREWGAHVVDADVLAREVVAPGEPGLAAVVAEFGAGVLSSDGSLDRDALAERVFADRTSCPGSRPSCTRWFTQQRWPARGRTQVGSPRLRGAPPGSEPVRRRAAVVVVDAPEAVRRQRLRGRGLDRRPGRLPAWRASRAAGVAGLADLVLDNSGTEADLRARWPGSGEKLTGEEPPVGAGG